MARTKIPYRLGLDLGSNSIGWWIVWLAPSSDRWRPVGLGPGGVRIFEDGRDPQAGTSNASDRRIARGTRVRRDRFVRRRRGLMEGLVAFGLMPADESARKALEGLDPYRLRAEALDAKLPVHHVGRALFHLNQRRGFQSNRKADAKAGDEKGAIKVGEKNLREMMDIDGAATLGAWLWGRHRKREAVRSRAEIKGTKAEYAFYPTREMLKDEFAAIWGAQARHHPEMTDDARAALFETIFHQRPLMDPVVGKCSLLPATEPPEKDPGGYRCPLADPRAQRFRILSDVRNLRVLTAGAEPKPLTPDRSAAALAAFSGAKEVRFDRLRTLLKLPAEATFNLEDDKREALLGDRTAVVLSDKKRFGKAWRSLSPERQCEIVDRLLDEPDEAALVKWLVEACGLTPEAAEKTAYAPLPEGHSRLGLNALKRLLPHMERGLSYPEAAAAEGLDHAKLGAEEPIGRLPHYGEWIPEAVVGTGDPNDPADKRFGRFPNPTVHIALGQLRRVVNALVDEHGPPTEVVLELTRSLKLSPDEKRKVQAEQRKNQMANERRAEEFRLHFKGAEPSPRDLLKIRLWEELSRDPVDRKCPFTGRQISFSKLMSEEVEIEHLISLGMSLDDSAANKTVCFREANRAKKKRTPFQAFGGSEGGYDWTAIAERAANLPRNKRWRFEPDAHLKYEEMGGFLARQLKETGWLARFAKRYLSAVTDRNSIWVTPGRLTSIVRAKWGLNALLPDHNYMGVQERDEAFRAATDSLEFSGVKNRADHRHHAIDAFVMAMTDRGLLNRAAYASARDDLDVDRIDVPEPAIENWRDELKTKVNAIVVSLKADHGVAGKLHEDTAYGLVRPRPDLKPGEEETENLVYRKPLESITEKEIGRIRDRRLRTLVEEHWYGAKRDGAALPDALKAFRDKAERGEIASAPHGLRSVRLLKSERIDYLVAVADRKTGEVYKAYSAGENFCVEIFETADGQWRGEAVNRFTANQPGKTPRWRAEHPGARLVMRIAKGDLVRLDHEGERKIMTVHRLDAAANRFKLAAHNETGNLDRRHATAQDIDPFRWLMASYGALKRLGAERVRVDELGTVRRVTRTRSVDDGVEGLDSLGDGWRAIS